MNIVLAIDTSSTDLGIGLYSNDRPVASFSRFVQNSHAEHISQTVKMILETNGFSADMITHVGICTGPGSFTGLRIGIAFVMGMCAGKEIKVAPLSSLHIMARSFYTIKDRTIFSAIDARKDQIFTASFRSTTDGGLIRLTEDKLCRIETLLEQSTPDDIIITDTMGFSRSVVFDKLENRRMVFSVEKYPIQRGLFASKVASEFIAENSFWKTASEIKPQYLRLSTPQLKVRK